MSFTKRLMQSKNMEENALLPPGLPHAPSMTLPTRTNHYYILLMGLISLAVCEHCITLRVSTILAL